MGLNVASAGASAAGGEQRKENVIALAGNPNVGKSTVFNALTGMKQHTGNWSGKTVAAAQGQCEHNGKKYILVDIPGCYSLAARSAEETAARDFICSGEADGVIVVCSATCLERNLNLALQIAEVTPRVTVCVNLMDEAEHKGISVDTHLLGQRLGLPVVGTSARGGEGLEKLMDEAERMTGSEKTNVYQLGYPSYIEAAVRWLMPELTDVPTKLRRFTALRLLEDSELPEALNSLVNEKERSRCDEVKKRIAEQGITEERLRDDIASAPGIAAHRICEGAAERTENGYSRKDMAIDRLLTGKRTAYPAMLLLLTAVLWITLSAANYPSELLRKGFLLLENGLDELLVRMKCPVMLGDMLSHGIFRIVGWVVSVMLPPMAIFFPMFTLLEDLGFLPRIAFDLDHAFKKCGACGKQALTACMGFGCNAAGVTGCRIIDSPRERLIAILTNCFVPCNGRFPALAAIITMFLAAGERNSSLISALMLAGTIVLGIIMTLAVSKLLSSTFLKGIPSAFMLELPPYRRPQWGQVLLRSIMDRTLFVLGRAVMTAAPAGLIIWLTANVKISGETLLTLCSRALDAPAAVMGLDGVILLAFILGFPANEIVVPIIIMAYTAQGTISDIGSLDALRALLTDNGWTWTTGVSMMLFSLMHWPCSTTCVTIFKETRSLKWTLLGIALPTMCGFAVCALFNLAVNIF